jgi:predicted nucleic acid-binding protein
VIVLDTNVIAELMRPSPEPRVLAWADRLDPAQVGITTMNQAEILHGIARRVLPSSLPPPWPGAPSWPPATGSISLGPGST